MDDCPSTEIDRSYLKKRLEDILQAFFALNQSTFINFDFNEIYKSLHVNHCIDHFLFL